MRRRATLAIAVIALLVPASGCGGGTGPAARDVVHDVVDEAPRVRDGLDDLNQARKAACSNAKAHEYAGTAQGSDGDDDAPIC
jgi:hypothetical protein